MRLQLALNVEDLDRAVDFYSKMFDTPPDKIRPGYANFAIEQPPLKLVLFEGAGDTGSINHLGVEVEAAAQVESAASRLQAEGLELTDVAETECCYAEKTETWLEGPDGTRWEWYVKHADSDSAAAQVHTLESSDGAGSCCSPVGGSPGESSCC